MSAVRKAEKLFETFHQFEPTKIGEFGPSFKIPREMLWVGEASVMYYTSDKLNPETGEDEGFIGYYHEHKPGVRMLVSDRSRDGDWRAVPKWIWGASALVKLGVCDGFDYVDFEGRTRSATARGRKPDWYTLPSGKALFVIQDRRSVLAIAYGGKLTVEWRGVVG